MPLVKKPSGWFWGSKGPFDSKTKALAVARAAYAHGYKEACDVLINYDLAYTSENRVNKTEKNEHNKF